MLLSLSLYGMKYLVIQNIKIGLNKAALLIIDLESESRIK